MNNRDRRACEELAREALTDLDKEHDGWPKPSTMTLIPGRDYLTREQEREVIDYINQKYGIENE